MSWGTYCSKHCIYLNHIGKNDLWSKKEECKRINDMLWNEMLAIAAMTPPVYAEDDEGNKYPWYEHIEMKMREYREEIEDNDRLVALIDEVIEEMEEHPENISEG